jgi:ParB-like chromosome segregation protein Spo0J
VKLNVNDIQVGRRHREDLGDVAGLAASMERVGLLHPIVVNSAHELIAGERRLAAAKALHWDEVDATVADNLDDIHAALMAERDENQHRKEFTPSEAAAMAAALEPYERQAADARMKAGRPPVNFTEGTKGRAADKVAEAVGRSRPTLAKAAAVVEAAKAHPGEYEDIRQEMDRTDKVSPAYKELARRQQEDGKPATRLPHRVVIDDPEETTFDSLDDLDPADYPVPDGPAPAEITRTDPVVILSGMIVKLWGGVNSFLVNGTLTKLMQRSAADRRRLTDSIGQLIAELQKLKAKLEKS